MRLFRSLSLAALGLVAAACGDKVTVTNPATPTPVVKTVTVAPATATITVGQALNLTAAVSADAGATYTVAWTTSDASKVSVNATTGAILGVAVTPGVAICASAGGKQGCASIIVATGIGTTPATVSIASVTVGNLNVPAPVPPGQVAGQFDVRLNVTANSVALDSVVVFIDGVSVAKQSFTAAQAAALLTASEMTAEQVLPVTVVISINSAACKVTRANGTVDLQAVCGFPNATASPPISNTPSWLNASTNGNGNRLITARGFGKFVGTTTVSNTTASQSVPIAFGNTSGWFTKIQLTQNTGQLASAADPVGFLWNSGGITVQAVPLIYYVQQDGITAQGVLSANLTYNNLGCSASQALVAPMTPVSAGSAIWTGSFTDIPLGATGAGAATNIGTYEFNSTATPGCANLLTTGGEPVAITGIGTDNNNLFAAVFTFNTTSNFNQNPDVSRRLDNVGVTAIAATTTPNGRTGNWMNDAVVLNGLNTFYPALAGSALAALRTANGIVTGGYDLGVSRVIGTCTFAAPPPGCVGSAATSALVFSARVGLAADAAATVDGTAAVTNLSGVAESATAAAYRIRLRGTDQLGNFNSLSVGNVGRDNTAPALTFIGGSAANARLAAYSVGSYTFSAADPATAPAAPSGFFNLAALPLSVTQSRRNVAGTTFFCPTSLLTGAYQSSGTACGAWTSGTNFFANLIVSEINIGAVSPVDAYYTTSATVADQAGNVSAPVARVQVDDITPAALALLAPTSFVAGGPSVFGGSMADNLDIQFLRLNLVYAGLAPVLVDQATGVAWVGFFSAFGASAFWNPDVQINGYNATPLIPTSNVAVSVNPTMTNVQPTTGAAGVNPAAVGTALTNTFGFVFNQANTLAFATAPILAPTLPPATAMSNTGAGPVPGPAGGPQNWLMTNTAGTTAISMTGAGGLATTITLNASAQGVTGVFQNPFSAVQFWAYDATPLTEGWHLIASVGADATSDNGVNRFWTFSTVWAPTAQSAPTTAACPGGTTYRVIATGVGGTNLPAAQQGMALATPVSQRLVTVCP